MAVELYRGRAIEAELKLGATMDHCGNGFRSPAACRWCQYGYATGTALAASNAATCSGESDQPIASRFWRSCSSFRAPTMTEAIVGLRVSQFNAICGTVFPVSLATTSSAS